MRRPFAFWEEDRLNSRIEWMCGVVEEHGNGTTGEASLCRVRATGENDRHARSEDDAGKLRSAKVFKLLGEHVAALEVGNDEDVGLPGDGRVEVLDFCGLDADGC